MTDSSPRSQGQGLEPLGKLPKRWQGYLTGTNRGRLWLKLTQKNGRVDGTALFYDQTFGPAVIKTEGVEQDRPLRLRILAFKSLTPLNNSPLDGEIALEFAEDLRSATGSWRTDVGTTGTGWLRSRGVPGFLLGRVLLARMVFSWRRLLPSLYTLLLGSLAFLGSLERIKLATPTIALLLVPAPYVFRRHIALLIQSLKLKKLGPVELGEQSPANPQLGLLVRQQVEETVRLFVLDGAFVPRTKALLAWLASRGSVTRQEFDQMASLFGVPAENLDTTRNVILEFGCATFTNDLITVLPWGRRYVAHLAGE